MNLFIIINVTHVRNCLTVLIKAQFDSDRFCAEDYQLEQVDVQNTRIGRTMFASKILNTRWHFTAYSKHKLTLLLFILL